MKINSIITEDPLREEKEIAKIEKILEQLRIDGDLSIINEEAEMYKFGNRWIVDYGQEVGSSNRPGALERDIGQFNSRRDAERALQQFRSTGRRTVTGNVVNAVGRWRQARGTATYERGQNLAFRMNGRFATGLRGFGIIARVIGIVQLWETHKEYAIDLYVDHHMGFITREQYDEALESHFTAFAFQVVTTILAAVASARTARAVLRGLRLASAGMGTLAGGPIGAAIGWLIGEGVTYAALWFLQRRSTVEAIVNFFYLEPILDMFSIDTAIANAFQNTQVLGTDLGRASGINYRGIEADRGTRDAVVGRDQQLRPAAPGAGAAAADLD